MEALRVIFAADRAARERCAAARRDTESFDDRLEAMSREAAESAKAGVDREVAAARRSSESAAKKRLRALDRERDEDIAALRVRFDRNKSAGVEKLFRLAVWLDD